jgi:hypothetical protein
MFSATGIYAAGHQGRLLRGLEQRFERRHGILALHLDDFANSA